MPVPVLSPEESLEVRRQMAAIHGLPEPGPYTPRKRLYGLVRLVCPNCPRGYDVRRKYHQKQTRAGKVYRCYDCGAVCAEA